MTAARTSLTAALTLFGAVAPAAGLDGFVYTRNVRSALEEGATVVDVRTLDECVRQSIAGARCLPASDFTGPHRRLAAYRDVLWLLGTAGLTGGETVLIVGQDAVERDFVAGLLHVAGQKRVLVASEPLPRILAAGGQSGPGRVRGFTRQVVYEAPMRDALIVLGRELRTMGPAPLVLDGRTEAEYWGGTVRGARGGHLPGAVSLPATRLRAGLNGTGTLLPTGSPIAYGHDAVEGLAYFTLLRAGHHVEALIYVEGWAEWSADGSLPVDSLTLPDLPAVRPSGVADRPAAGLSWPMSLGIVAGAFALALTALLAGFLVPRARAH